MATVLMIWEQGSGLGHLSAMFPVANSLQEDGHRVYVAAKDFSKCHMIFEEGKFSIIPSPVLSGPIKGAHRLPSTFAEIMHNAGFGDINVLGSLANSWHVIFDLVKPDLIITDHSPVAMLAARSRSIKLITLGTGFSCPGPCQNYPDWRPKLKRLPTELLRSEGNVLKNANIILARHKANLLNKLSDLYTESDDCLLVTYPELDPFENRTQDYLGVFPDSGGLIPRWQDNDKPKVFAYLRPLKGVEDLLTALSSAGYAALVRMPGAPAALKAKFPSIQWEEQFVDLTNAAQQAKFCIGHGTHMMTARWLLVGKPVLMYPPYLEQGLTARKVVAMGAGVVTGATTLSGFKKVLNYMQDKNDRLEESAKTFANRYQATTTSDSLRKAMEKVHQHI